MRNEDARRAVAYASDLGIDARVIASGDKHPLCYMVVLPAAVKSSSGTDWYHVNLVRVMHEIDSLAA